MANKIVGKTFLRGRTAHDSTKSETLLYAATQSFVDGMIFLLMQ